MARALKSSDAFETTLQMRLKEEIAGMRFGGCADAIGILPTLLRDYLADKALKSVEGMEMRVEQWLDERKRWHESVKAAVSAGECRRLRTTLAGRSKGCSRSSADLRATAPRRRNVASTS